MQLATIKNDFWELKSGEVCHEESPDTFWIPEKEERLNLKLGDAAKVIIEIESEDDLGNIHLQGERMYVIVSEILENFYIGILDSQPASLEPSDDNYLCFGAEIPFMAEHVIDINRPPEDYIEWQLNQKPERTWYRK